MVNDFGKQALAGFSAAARIENFAAVPWVALSSSMSTFTAQNIGAGKNERIRLGFRMCVDGILRGAADTRAFTVANLVNLSLRVAISFSLAPKYGVSLVWIASPIDWFANFLISYMHYVRKNLRETENKSVDLQSDGLNYKSTS